MGKRITLFYDGKPHEIDLCKPPENLEEITRKVFKAYTADTRTEYRYKDKLKFIDDLQDKLNPADFKEFAKDYLYSRMDALFVKNISDGKNYLSCDVEDGEFRNFAECCFENGNKKLYFPYEYNREYMSKDERDTALKSVERIVKTVMNYPEGK